MDSLGKVGEFFGFVVLGMVERRFCGEDGLELGGFFRGGVGTR